MNHIEIICEAGINHLSSNEIIREMIYVAKDAGADTFKVQLYDPRKVFGDPPREPDKFTKLEWEAIYSARLGKRQVFWIKQECETVGLNFLASVSDLERLEWLEQLGVERYKIASDDALDKEFCLEILKKEKPVIISSGHIKPFEWRLQYGNKKRPDKWIFRPQWLYCVSEYPTNLGSLNFSSEDLDFSAFASYFETPEYYGFSDHTVGISAAVVAMSLGAKIIEKHFTLDKTLPGPDQICSADPDELRQLCKFRDDIEKILYKN